MKEQDDIVMNILKQKELEMVQNEENEEELGLDFNIFEDRRPDAATAVEAVEEEQPTTASDAMMLDKIK